MGDRERNVEDAAVDNHGSEVSVSDEAKLYHYRLDLPRQIR